MLVTAFSAAAGQPGMGPGRGRLSAIVSSVGAATGPRNQRSSVPDPRARLRSPAVRPLKVAVRSPGWAGLAS